MLRRYRKLPMPDLLNASVNQTLSRSVITHVTVSLALLALLLFGGQAIHSFTATMMFGVVLVGTYTSVFIASPILIYLGVGTGRDSLTRAGPGQDVDGARRAGGRSASAAPGAYRCLWRRRLPFWWHVASRLVAVFPDGIWAWPVRSAAELSASALEPAFDRAEKLDFFLIGAGRDPGCCRNACAADSANFRSRSTAMPTGAAVRTYNILLAENRRVGAGLIAVA